MQLRRGRRHVVHRCGHIRRYGCQIDAFRRRCCASWTRRLKVARHDGKAVGANPGDHVTFECEYATTTRRRVNDPAVSFNGVVVSMLSTTSGVGAGWDTDELHAMRHTKQIASSHRADCNVASSDGVPAGQVRHRARAPHHLNTTLAMDVAEIQITVVLLRLRVLRGIW